MQLEGFLSRFSLRELLELCVASLVNGAIEVQAPSGMYRLYFVAGECVHAASPDAAGQEAIWPLFELSDAPFRFVAGLTTSERTITASTREVIDTAEAVARRWSTIRPHISRLDIVPVFAMPSDGEQVRIFEEDWPVLSCVDGTRTIKEVAERAVLDPSEVCAALLRLKERGLVHLQEQSDSVPRQPAVPAPKLVESIREAPAKGAGPTVETVAPVVPSTGLPARRRSFFGKLLSEVAPEMVTPVMVMDPSIPEVPTETDDILRLLRA
jgi:hypothetical protein